MADEADVDTKRAAPVAGIAPRSTADLRKDVLAAGGVFLFAFTLYLLPAASSRPLSETAEARVAVVAREMIRSGDYIVPVFNHEPRLTKPPLPYWLAAGAATVLSSSDGPTTRVMTRATLLPPALIGALTLFLIVLYGSLVFGRPAGVMAALMLGFSAMVCRYAQMGYGDTTLMFTCTGMFCSAAWMMCAPRPGFMSAVALGGSLGLAVLTKGHVPVLLLAGPVLVEVLIRRRFNGRKVALFFGALVIAAAVAGWWYAMVLQRVPGGYEKMLFEAKQVLDPKNHVQDDRWFYYIYKLAGGLLPWSPLLLIGWVLYLDRDKTAEKADHSGVALIAREHLRFFIIAAFCGFIGLYAIEKQVEYYLLPILPVFALASGSMLSHFKVPGGPSEENLAWTQVVIAVLGALAIATLPYWPVSSIAELRTADFLGLPLQSSAWMLSVPVGILFLVLQLYCARQFVEGKPLVSTIAVSVVAYAMLAGWSVHWAQKSKKTNSLNNEAAELRTRLNQLDPGTQVYAVGMPEPLVVYYVDLGRPIKTRDQLIEEPTGKIGPDAPQRVMLLRRNDLAVLEKDYGLDIDEQTRSGKEPIIILPLSKDKDWPAQIGVKKVKKPREE